MAASIALISTADIELNSDILLLEIDNLWLTVVEDERLNVEDGEDERGVWISELVEL